MSDALRIRQVGSTAGGGGGGGSLTVFTQSSPPSAAQLSDGDSAIWVDTDTGQAFLVFRQAGGQLKSVELASIPG